MITLEKICEICGNDQNLLQRGFEAILEPIMVFNGRTVYVCNNSCTPCQHYCVNDSGNCEEISEMPCDPVWARFQVEAGKPRLSYVSAMLTGRHQNLF